MLKHDPVAHWPVPVPWVMPSIVPAGRGEAAVEQHASGVELQTPPEQALVVQGLPSGHGSVLLVNTQLPDAMSHVSVVQMLLSLHTLAVPLQTPVDVQASFSVHALLSVQGVPVGAFGLLHTPVAGAQVPATWH